MKHNYRYAVLLSTFMLLGMVAFSSPRSADAATPFFYYTFNAAGTLNEAASMLESTSPYWWVNSGGQMPMDGTVGSTIQGTLPLTSPWRTLYGASNPTDTDNGAHPQNIFRLITKSTATDVREEAFFQIKADNLSQSANRNESNALLLFSRYQNSATLYYAGLRVDGGAVIKKKVNGTYYTLIYKKVLPGIYDRTTQPNLIQKNTWIGLRTETKTNTDGSVSIRLFTDIGKTGTWTLAVEARDNGTVGGAPITAAGSTGIRTDFMDVQFDNFRLEQI